MTWPQFKEKIEAQMREKGIDENTEVRNIDTNMATVKVIEREGYIIVE